MDEINKPAFFKICILMVDLYEKKEVIQFLKKCISKGGFVVGAKKLYIAAHPAEETQKFYKSVGCLPAIEVNREIYDKEPLDIQLEFEL